MISNCKKMVRMHEGFKDKIYKDTLSNLTVGYGTHLYEGKKLSLTAIEAMFDADYNQAVADIEGLGISLSDVRKAVLVDMCYNMGLSKLLGFKKMLEALKSSDYEKASAEIQDSLWAKQVGKRAERLVKMMLLDKWYTEF